MEKKTALILDGHAIQALPVCKKLIELGYSTVSFCSEKYSYGYFSKYSNQSVLVTALNNSDEYYLTLLNYLKKYSIDVVIPMIDENAKLVSIHKNEILEYTFTL